MNASITVIPHLSFDGNCEEAICAYIKAFGGEILYLSRWSKETCSCNPSRAGKVMHAEFLIGQTRMSANDPISYLPPNETIKFMIHASCHAEAENAISILAEGGTILSALKPHPKPDDAGCGSITQDRFGYNWIITCPNPEKELCSWG